MKLRLQFPPTPENAAKLAELAVAAARNVDGIDLDYSPESLASVDQILGSFHEEGLTEKQVGETVFSFGCYVGEILVRHHNGKWALPKASFLAKLGFGGSNMMLVELPNGSTWNPIGKAFKLIENGQEDSVAYLYTVATQDAEPTHLCPRKSRERTAEL
jgi:hypothetical protein